MAAAYELFFANGTNIVANRVKKQHKIYENSSIVFNGKYWQKKAQFKNSKKQNKLYIVLKWQRLAKIGKMWDKQTAAKSGIKFTLAFSGKYWHKKSDKMRVRKPYGKKWQIMAMNGTSFNNWPKFSERVTF